MQQKPQREKLPFAFGADLLNWISCHLADYLRRVGEDQVKNLRQLVEDLVIMEIG